MIDSKQNGIKFLLNTKVTDIKKENNKWKIILNHEHEIFAKFIINAAGGESIDIAHSVDIAKNLTDVHFRGEYWKAPKEYYNLTKRSVYSNLKEFIPKMLEMLGSGARKAIFDKQFQELAINEIQSSMSKSSMIDRVKSFLPKIDADKITEKGTAGIRSSVIDENGKFVPDVILLEEPSSFTLFC